MDLHALAEQVWPNTRIEVLEFPNGVFIWDESEDQCLLCAGTHARAERAMRAMLNESPDWATKLAKHWREMAKDEDDPAVAAARKMCASDLELHAKGQPSALKAPATMVAASLPESQIERCHLMAEKLWPEAEKIEVTNGLRGCDPATAFVRIDGEVLVDVAAPNAHALDAVEAALCALGEEDRYHSLKRYADTMRERAETAERFIEQLAQFFRDHSPTKGTTAP